MTTTCACDRPTRDDAYVCDDCLDLLARDLGDVPWLVDELDTTASKQRSPGAPGSPSAEKPLPINHAATEARSNLRHELVLLVRFCDEEGVRSRHDGEIPGDVDHPATEVDLSRWLMWRVDGLAFVDMAPEFVSSVRRAVRACRRVIDLPPERQYAGPCPECSRDLYHRPNAKIVRCSDCGIEAEVEKVREWMEQRINEHMADRLVTAREGATLLSRFGLEVGQGTIDKWHQRKMLASAGHEQRNGSDGPRLYRWDDLLSLAARNERAS